MASYVTMMSKVQLAPNTKILQIVKKHDHIRASDPLITFEHEFEDEDANKILDSLTDDFAEFVEDMGKGTKKSKFSGEIIDIKIFYNVPKEECSESIQKLLIDYEQEVNNRKEITLRTDNKSTIFPLTEQIHGDKIKSTTMEGIMIEFYIKHRDKLKTGDKVTYGTALKTIISDVLPEGEEPYSERHKDEKIAAILSPMSVVSRMTTDFYNMMYTNKLILEMKEKMRDIWES